MHARLHLGNFTSWQVSPLRQDCKMLGKSLTLCV